MKRVWALLLAGCMLLLCLTACGKSDGSMSVNQEVEMSAEDFGLTDGAASQTNVDLTRKQIRNAVLTVETKTYDAALTSVEQKVGELNGYVESSDSFGSGSGRGYRSATLVLRIPAEQLDAFLSAVGEVGNLVSQSIETKDVTVNYVDVESRLNALKAEQEALTDLLKAASSLSDILDIRDRLAEVTGEIESFQAQLQLLDSQVAYSTVTLTLDEVEVESLGNGQGFWNETGTRFLNNLAKLGKVLRALAIWLISDVPFLLVLVGVVVLIVWIVRVILRRRNKRRTPPKA